MTKYSGFVYMDSGAVVTIDVDDEGDAELILANYRTARARPSRNDIEELIAMLQEAHRAIAPDDWNPNAV